MVYLESAPSPFWAHIPYTIKLTSRERQLLDAAAQGHTDRQISDELSISVETVSSYWRGVRLKFQASTRTECVARYSRQQAESLVEQHQHESDQLMRQIMEASEAREKEIAQKKLLSAMVQQISASEALVRELVDRIPAGILFESSTRVVQFANETFIAMFGFPEMPKQVIGASWFDALIAVSRRFVAPDEFISRIEELIEAGVSVRGDVLSLIDGRRIERDFVVVTSEGIVRGYLWCHRDVTRTTFTRKSDVADQVNRATAI